MNPFLWGACTFAFAAAAVFFVRFWRQTADRFFAIFAIGLAFLSSNYAVLGAMQIDETTRQYAYLLRLVAFLCLIGGIVDKNRRA
jgi:uncharacterized membrane protein YoaK (UPF0700 family)